MCRRWAMKSKSAFRWKQPRTNRCPGANTSGPRFAARFLIQALDWAMRPIKSGLDHDFVCVYPQLHRRAILDIWNARREHFNHRGILEVIFFCSRVRIVDPAGRPVLLENNLATRKRKIFRRMVRGPAHCLEDKPRCMHDPAPRPDRNVKGCRENAGEIQPQCSKLRQLKSQGSIRVTWVAALTGSHPVPGLHNSGYDNPLRGGHDFATIDYVVPDALASCNSRNLGSEVSLCIGCARGRLRMR